MSSKDRHGRKKDGSRQTPKQASTVIQGGGDGVMPENLGFLYTIDQVNVVDGKKPQDILGVGPEKGNNIAKLWFPPTYAYRFRHRHGNLYRWSMGESKLVDMKRPKVYDDASVFFQPRQDNFVITHSNCANDDVEKQSAGWGYVSFHHLNGNISEVDFAGSKFGLAAPASNSTWMPQILPQVYDYDARGRTRDSPGKSGGLCGKLAILIAMAAFSAQENRAEEIVAKCFKLRSWKHHELETGIGRYQNRGVIVSIYLDPTAANITKDHLKAFERGAYGPIWDYESISRTDTRTALSATSRLDSSVGSIPRNATSYTIQAYAAAQSSAIAYTHTAPSAFQYAPSIVDSSQLAQDDNKGERDEENIYDPPP